MDIEAVSFLLSDSILYGIGIFELENKPDFLACCGASSMV
jgi:hypothetical protein